MDRLLAAALGVLFLSGPALALEGWTKEGDRWIRLVRRGERKAKGWTNRLAYKLSVPGSYDPKSPMMPSFCFFHREPNAAPQPFGSLVGSFGPP